MMEMNEHNISPLEIIRYKEAEATRRLAAARETTVTETKAIEQQARNLVRQAEIQGQREGEAQRQAGLDEAEREAESILVQAMAQAEALRNVSQVEVETVVAQALTIIIGVAWPAQEK
jgi:vacuolar-type H+-ATPase subunit H